MTMLWVTNELPSIFLSVLKLESMAIEIEKPSVTSKAHGYSCSLCDFKTARSAVLKTHKKTQHNLSIQCFYCDQSIQNTSEQLSKHREECREPISLSNERNEHKSPFQI